MNGYESLGTIREIPCSLYFPIYIYLPISLFFVFLMLMGPSQSTQLIVKVGSSTISGLAVKLYVRPEHKKGRTTSIKDTIKKELGFT